MKRCLALVLTAAMLCTTAIVAMASNNSWVSETNVYPGSTVTVHGFYDKDGGELDESSLDTEYFGVRGSFDKNGDLVERVYIDNNNYEVKLVIKTGIPVSREKDIIGSIIVTDRENHKRYTAQIDEGMLVLGGVGSANMEYVGNESFELPDNYQTSKIKFKTEDGDAKGILRADFVDSKYRTIAYFNVLVVDQSSLFLGHNQTANLDMVKKYSNADLRFLTWSATPTFDATGTLGIVMDSDEFIYGVKADGSLYKLGGKYNSDTGAYEIKTKTLGSYVISNKALDATGTATSASSAPASSSTAAPVTTPPSSSVAPPPPSSSAPASSSVPAPSSSSTAESSSQPSESSAAPESSEAPAESSSEASSAPTVAPAETEKEGGFPFIPVIIGVLAVVVVALGIFLFTGKKRRNYDSWDD